MSVNSSAAAAEADERVARDRARGCHGCGSRGGMSFERVTLRRREVPAPVQNVLQVFLRASHRKPCILHARQHSGNEFAVVIHAV